MAKWSGKIGFIEYEESSPGVISEEPKERLYYGDMIENVRRLQNSGEINDDVVIQNELSIVADPYAYQNFHNIKYVHYMNSKWKVNSIRVNRPRLILSLGGVYND